MRRFLVSEVLLQLEQGWQGWRERGRNWPVGLAGLGRVWGRVWVRVWGWRVKWLGVMGTSADFGVRCRANMVHIRQSSSDSGRGMKVSVLKKTSQGDPSSLGDGIDRLLTMWCVCVCVLEMNTAPGLQTTAVKL